MGPGSVPPRTRLVHRVQEGGASEGGGLPRWGRPQSEVVFFVPLVVGDAMGAFEGHGFHPVALCFLPGLLRRAMKHGSVFGSFILCVCMCVCVCVCVCVCAWCVCMCVSCADMCQCGVHNEGRSRAQDDGWLFTHQLQNNIRAYCTK